MSVLFSDNSGWVVSHEKFIAEMYEGVNVEGTTQSLHFNHYFHLTQPFTRGNLSFGCSKTNRKRIRTVLSDEVILIKNKFKELIQLTNGKSILTLQQDNSGSNDSSRFSAHQCLESINDLGVLSGGNLNNHPVITDIEKESYLFPPNCSFINDDISSIKKHIKTKFDFILLDPPWYNRFVKRRKKYHPQHGYDFLGEKELCEVPVSSLLEEEGLVAVWTTNSPSHIATVKHCLFPSWGLTYTSTWFWIKVTKHGELIVPFSSEGKKQPYERIIFGSRENRSIPNPEDNKCIISQPSSIHSHKPPLVEVLKDYVAEDGKCLELFARYLLPGWTSMGNQVLSLQLKSLYSSTS